MSKSSPQYSDEVHRLIDNLYKELYRAYSSGLKDDNVDIFKDTYIR